MGCYGLRSRPAGASLGHVHPQRSALYQSGAEGGRILLAAWERFWGMNFGVGFVELVLCGGALAVCCPESRFLRAAPRGVLRWRGARGALRPLFLLRSCAADQEKRPEKKSWAVMACAPIRLERLWGTCIRSAAGCCTIHTSEASLPAAPCAPLCGARGAAPVLRTQDAPVQRFPRACGSQDLSFGRLFFPFGV